MKILCTGDLHLGQRSTRVPDRHARGPIACTDVWRAIVDYAIDQRVDLVALSGDLVDEHNRYFEARGPLEAGLSRLAQAGIDVYAVAGNHDFDVLPSLAADIGLDRFRLLGRGGVWERATVMRGDEPVLHIDGWSFPSRWVHTNPLADYPMRPADDVPVLGLLHADLYNPGSTYGPVALADLQAHPVTLWLLGHIHAPAHHHAPGRPCVLYPGSPQAMHPNEPGLHGPWLVQIDRGQPPVLQQVPLSSVRYCVVELDLTGIDDPEVARSAIYRAVRNELAAARADDPTGRLRCLSCRVRVSGRTRLHRELDGLLQTAQEDLAVEDGGVTAHIDRFEQATRPLIDLTQLQTRSDPTGELARLLLALDSDAPLPEVYHGLIQRTVAKLRAMHDARWYQVIDDAPPNAEVARRYLSEQGWTLLDTLLAQREPA